MQQRQDIICVELTVDEAQEIIKSLPEQNWAALSVTAKLKDLLSKKQQRDSHPHKLADDYETMKKLSLPWRLALLLPLQI